MQQSVNALHPENAPAPLDYKYKDFKVKRYVFYSSVSQFIKKKNCEILKSEKVDNSKL